MEDNDSESGISNSEVAECKRQLKRKGDNLRKDYKLGVEKSALNRKARKAQQQLEQAKELASQDLERQVMEAERDLKMRQNALRLKELEKTITSIKLRKVPLKTEEESEEEHEMPIKKVIRKRRPAKKALVVKEATETEDSEIEPKVFKKELVKRQVEQKVDTLRDEIIKKYMNNLFPKY